MASSLFRPLAVLLLSLPLLAGCAQGPGNVPAGGPAYGALPPIVLDVAGIEVVDQYRAPRAKPNVEHLVALAPAQAVRGWVAERLRANGSAGSARVMIKDASIQEVELPRTQGIKGMFTRDQAQRYDARIQVEVMGQSPRNNFNGFASATVTRSVTVAEDISVAGREAVLAGLVRQLMDDLNARLDPEIRHDLAAIVLR
jgi:hypothetical protein